MTKNSRAAASGPGFSVRVMFNRLEEIIKGTDFEGTNRVTIVGGHEDNVGEGFVPDCFDDIEARLAGHLNIQENNIWLEVFDQLDGV